MSLGMDRRALLAGMASLAAAPQAAHAAWPDRPISIVHGFGAGGNADVVARIEARAGG